jgi:nucleoid DNA-binding protein
MKTITKKEVIQKIAIKNRLDPKEVHLTIQDFLDYITENLQEGNRFEFRDFGVFEIMEKKAKIPITPKTKKTFPFLKRLNNIHPKNI